MKIIYDKSLNEHVRPIIEERLNTVKDLFPRWCIEVVVFYQLQTSETLTLACEPNYPYRFIQLVVYPGFFDDPLWQQSLLHEIQHGILSPYVSQTEYIIKTYIEDPSLRQVFLHDLSEREESVAQDLTLHIEQYAEKKNCSEKQTY